MGMFDNFDATSETEGVEKNDFTPFPAGTYSLIVDECVETQSKAGNDMLRVVLHVNGGDHAGRKVFDYIVPEASPYAVAKLKNFALSAGLNTLTSADQLEGATVRAKIKIEPAKGDYSASNKIGDYLPRPAGMAPPVQDSVQAAPVPARAGSTDWSDDVPF